MKLDLFQIDSFTNQIFHGNPACVIPLNEWLPDETLLKIAKENAVAETAFFMNHGAKIHLRWFTPEIEMDLCGHATLAAAHAIKQILGYTKNSIVFETLSGDLTVEIKGELYLLNFPSRNPVQADLPEIIKNALNIQPRQVLKSRDFVLVYENESEIRDIQIDRQLFDQINLDPGGVVVTAKGDSFDFVSRFFTPQASILEDPVTGSSHCSLIPYWSDQLGKTEMKAMQLSERTGELNCINLGDRVIIGGNARTFSIGSCWIE
ncbi:isomerase [Pedobacter lusitanus]|uniref:Isomerase n=1 Tax=Pedobacter lusitanus TaxID=1503925 RepID=A0A0D0F2S6_9SPHI|nr:PhzF family phenazine biosynthesis protein [Pedobacter lusitanus]KIO75843.1 isomerase [Pedobacter lusitanus]